MRAAEQVQVASLRHLFYRLGYGRIVSHSQVDRLPAFYSATRPAMKLHSIRRVSSGKARAQGEDVRGSKQDKYELPRG
jgi:hypothetical protein